MSNDSLHRRAKAAEVSWLRKKGYSSISATRKQMKNKRQRAAARAAGGNTRHNFYRGERWLRIRKKVFAMYGAVCAKCGATSRDKEMHVDHIKPRSKYPKLEYVFENLQILCAPCNMEKSNLNCNDYRALPSPAVAISRYFGLKFERVPD